MPILGPESDPPPHRLAAGPASADVILHAAEELFAAKGFKRTTIKDISNASGMNSALIYYYFDNKTRLYHLILTRLVLALKKRAVPAIKKARSMEDMIRGIVDAQVTLFGNHPRAAALLIREMVDHQAEFAHGLITQLTAELFRPACRIIDRGKQDGSIRADIDSRYAAISTIAQVVYFSLAGPAIRLWLERRGPFPTIPDLKEFGRHASEFAIAALRPVPTPSDARHPWGRAARAELRADPPTAAERAEMRAWSKSNKSRSRPRSRP